MSDRFGALIARDDDDKITPSPDKNTFIDEQLDGGGDSGQEEDEEEQVVDEYEIDRYWPPPISESIELVGSYSSKTISALTFNNAGTRFAAGGHDYEVRIWDFQAIDLQHPTSICNTQPCGQTVVKSLDFTNNDELILVISGGCQAIVIAKDGIIAKQYQCPKGDQYISDMSNTKGHVQMLNDGCWNPKDKTIFLTCSNDSTLRIWDLNKLSQQKTVIKTRSPTSGLKALPNVCKYSRDALSIIAGCNDGSVMMWDTRRKFITTSACIKNAHLKGSEITGIDFAHGQGKICTRSEDESCKIWDTRQLRVPLATQTGFTTLYSTTDCCFSPDDKLIITGTSNTKQEPGHLHFLDANDLSIKSSVDTPGTSVVRSRWHPKINHVAYSCSNGSIFVAYDKSRSLGGFLVSQELLRNRVGKRKKYISERGDPSSEPLAAKKIITPHALPLFRDDQSSSSSASFAKLRQDPKKSYKPEMPVSGVSQGGRVKPAGSTLSSFIARNIAKPKDDGGLDIRERILRHAEEAEKEPLWVKPAQGQSQQQQQRRPQQPNHRNNPEQKQDQQQQQ